MNPRKLRNEFRALTGISLSEFITEIRIDLAERYLIKGDETITEIALNVGFTTPSYFSNVFKEKHGCHQQRTAKRCTLKQIQK